MEARGEELAQVWFGWVELKEKQVRAEGREAPVAKEGRTQKIIECHTTWMRDHRMGRDSTGTRKFKEQRSNGSHRRRRDNLRRRRAWEGEQKGGAEPASVDANTGERSRACRSRVGPGRLWTGFSRYRTVGGRGAGTGRKRQKRGADGSEEPIRKKLMQQRRSRADRARNHLSGQGGSVGGKTGVYEHNFEPGEVSWKRTQGGGKHGEIQWTRQRREVLNVKGKFQGEARSPKQAEWECVAEDEVSGEEEGHRGTHEQVLR
jgi:hypothetical protein